VTILCPFGWGTTNLLGLNPTAPLFLDAVAARRRAVPTEFRREPDVWIEESAAVASHAARYDA
jgi:hypothetical protein